jgi:hypothetical protein
MTRGWKASNHRRRKDKESESSIDLTAHNQILKQKQLNGRNHHMPININTVTGFNSPIKRSDNLLFTRDTSY